MGLWETIFAEVLGFSSVEIDQLKEDIIAKDSIIRAQNKAITQLKARIRDLEYAYNNGGGIY